jgi:hypothetical protein
LLIPEIFEMLRPDKRLSVEGSEGDIGSAWRLRPVWAGRRIEVEFKKDKSETHSIKGISLGKLMKDSMGISEGMLVSDELEGKTS